jgi:lipoate-protein ligase B
METKERDLSHFSVIYPCGAYEYQMYRFLFETECGWLGMKQRYA